MEESEPSKIHKLPTTERIEKLMMQRDAFAFDVIAQFRDHPDRTDEAKKTQRETLRGSSLHELEHLLDLHRRNPDHFTVPYIYEIAVAYLRKRNMPTPEGTADSVESADPAEREQFFKAAEARANEILDATSNCDPKGVEEVRAFFASPRFLSEFNGNDLSRFMGQIILGASKEQVAAEPERYRGLATAFMEIKG